MGEGVIPGGFPLIGGVAVASHSGEMLQDPLEPPVGGLSSGVKCADQVFEGLLARVMAGSSSRNIAPSGSGNRGHTKTLAPSWAKVASGSTTPSPAAKKMNLKFLQPVLLEGRPRVTTTAEIAVEGAKRWASTLVGCFVRGSLPFSAVNNIARKIWSSDGLVDVLTIEKGFFLFRFASEDGMTNVVEKGPWLFAGRYMVLRKWSPGLPLSRANLHRIPVWAKFHNVPIEL